MNISYSKDLKPTTAVHFEKIKFGAAFFVNSLICKNTHTNTHTYPRTCLYESVVYQNNKICESIRNKHSTFTTTYRDAV